MRINLWEPPRGRYTVESLFLFDAVHVLTVQRGDLCLSNLTDAPETCLSRARKISRAGGN